MDTKLTTLFYAGIIAPTIITVAVFIAFLVCLCKCNKRKSSTVNKRFCAPMKITNTEKISAKDKLENGSQCSRDSAIDLGEIDASTDACVREKRYTPEKTIGVTNLAYKNEVINCAETALSTELLKGQYPSQEKYSNEVHGKIKVYEHILEMQQVALKLQADESGPDFKESLYVDVPQKDNSVPRYTTAPELNHVQKQQTTQINQLSKSGNKSKDTTLSSWYEKNDQVTLYNNRYNSNSSWKPNIAVSCSSATENYSTVEPFRV